MTQDLLMYAIATIVLLTIVYIFAVTIYNSKGKNKAIEFMYGLSEKMISISLEIIKDFDPSKYETIEEFETACLSTIYTKLWEYTREEAEKELEDGSLIKMAFQYIDSETLIKIIDDIFTNQGIFEKVEARYGEYNIENNIDVSPDKYEESEYFENAEATEVDLEPVEEKEPTEEEIAAINPPRETEEEFDSEDISMEILDDEFPKIIIQKDKNGNDLYFELYLDGRKKRVKKDYAEAHMKG